ncbi:MAG: anti-sigma factor antagonist [Lachnospiraceae bacterium]|nr:anti-sigma factor antagonist [Lachnospiraceae bacterium]
MKTKLKKNILAVWLEGRVDTNNYQQVDNELQEVLAGSEVSSLIINAEDLNYISSAGIRILVKLRKQFGDYKIINVSDDVYDIFQVTGMTEVLDIRKKLRSISIDGCEKIAEGMNGEVYRIDEDKIVKVYKSWISMDSIEKERTYARTAFVNGIPSVIAYDTVKCGDNLGVVFELINSDTLANVIKNDPENLDNYVDQYVELARNLHSTHVPVGSFPDIHDLLYSRLPKLERWCTPSELSVLESIIEFIPYGDTITHNYLTPSNIMFQDGELVIIDMHEVTMGPPICDLVSIYKDMIAAPKQIPQVAEENIGMPADLITKVGNMFLSRYTGITEELTFQNYLSQLNLIYTVDACFTVANGSEEAEELAPAIINQLLRGVVIPNEQAIKQIYNGF